MFSLDVPKIRNTALITTTLDPSGLNVVDCGLLEFQLLRRRRSCRESDDLLTSETRKVWIVQKRLQLMFSELYIYSDKSTHSRDFSSKKTFCWASWDSTPSGLVSRLHLDSEELRQRPPGTPQDQSGIYFDMSTYGLTHISLPCRETLNVFFMSVN